MSRVAKVLHLPAVTAYLVTGLFLGPYMLGAAHIPYLGFASMDAVEGYNILSQVALGFIAFTIGNEFRVMQLKSMGRQAVTVGIFQAVITTVIVDAALCVLHVFRPDIISLPSAITLGAIAAATAPAATLMVVRQYKAHGLLTHLLLMVVAIDDAVGLVLFAASYGVANALEQGSVSVISVVVEPLLEIVLSLLLGTVAGLFMNWIEKYFHSREKRIAISVAFVLLMVGASMMEFDIGEVHIGFSLLLVCMMTGTVFCNICETSEELMGHVDQWTAPINVLFFIISGVALGMATTAANLSDGAVVRNVVLFSVLVYEQVGPTLTKRSLIAAGEIAT
ncbi:MAG: cation:proton antiporter, partial [Clostridiales bacterium]|nr:cation:proton antiporter [Clostridiales bacterium]